jgi:hypothetical protein
MDPDRHVGYIVNSGGRGTLDLLWSCLVTIAFCTWATQRSQIVPWSTPKILILRKRIFWMFITLLCPEYVAWVAFGQWQQAWKYKEVCALGGKDWTIEHGFYVDMGGFQVVLEEMNPGIHFAQGNCDVLEIDGCLRLTVRLDDMILLMKADLLSVPNIHIHDLKERNKNNKFATAITYLQVLYFVVHCLGRLGSKLPISTLEVCTLAFICCAAFIEYFWWHKPLDLRTTTVTTLHPEKQLSFLSIFPRLRFNASEQDLAESSSFRQFFDRALSKEERGSTIHVVWIGCIFNGIHILAWNFSFPSDIERLLWQITSVCACVVFASAWAATFCRPKIARVCAITFSILYCICRSYLVLEAFVGLRSVPEALYWSTPWQNALPGV